VFLLTSCIQIFKDATLFFSCSSPNLSTVIPAMDFIDETLTTQSLKDKEFSPCIRAALTLGKKTLNQYYDKTDNSEVFRIAMSKYYDIFYFLPIHRYTCLVLDPRHKLAYFTAAEWEAAWIAAAKAIVHAEYDRKYAPATTVSKPVSTVPVSFIVEHSVQCKSNLAKPEGANLFDSLPQLRNLYAAATRNKLDIYLGSDPENVSDEIGWWNNRRDHFPNLSRMALDYLTIPGRTAYVECLFSRISQNCV
jgi:hypothetical protein